MKQKILSFMAFVLLMSSVLSAALGVGALSVPTDVDRSVKIYDQANLFSADERSLLSQHLQKAGNQLKMDLVIVTANDIKGTTSRVYADDFYDYNSFGYGPTKDGLLMLIDMDHRNVWISTTGKAETMFTSEKIDGILDDVAPNLTNGNYYSACKAFISKTKHYVWDSVFISPQTFLIFLGISLAIGGITVLIMMSLNKNVKAASQAANYTRPGSFKLLEQYDHFIRTHTSRIAIPKDTDSGGSSSGNLGGGGSHISSSGTSHGGGGRSF